MMQVQRFSEHVEYKSEISKFMPVPLLCNLCVSMINLKDKDKLEMLSLKWN